MEVEAEEHKSVHREPLAAAIGTKMKSAHPSQTSPREGIQTRRTKCFILIKGRNEEEKVTRPPCDSRTLSRLSFETQDYEAACHFMLIGAVA